jgi:hypothetical protein
VGGGSRDDLQEAQRVVAEDHEGVRLQAEHEHLLLDHERRRGHNHQREVEILERAQIAGGGVDLAAAEGGVGCERIADQH